MKRGGKIKSVKMYKLEGNESVIPTGKEDILEYLLKVYKIVNAMERFVKEIKSITQKP